MGGFQGFRVEGLGFRGLGLGISGLGFWGKRQRVVVGLGWGSGFCRIAAVC